MNTNLSRLLRAGVLAGGLIAVERRCGARRGDDRAASTGCSPATRWWCRSRSRSTIDGNASPSRPLVAHPVHAASGATSSGSTPLGSSGPPDARATPTRRTTGGTRPARATRSRSRSPRPVPVARQRGERPRAGPVDVRGTARRIARPARPARPVRPVRAHRARPAPRRAVRSAVRQPGAGAGLASPVDGERQRGSAAVAHGGVRGSTPVGATGGGTTAW